MAHILITGFDPFGGEAVNAAWETVGLLPEFLRGCAVQKLQIPTVFGRAAETVLQAVRNDPPELIILTGQAGGRAKVTPEYCALNVRHASIPDNDGQMPQFARCEPNGPGACFTTLDLERAVRETAAAGLPAAVSFHAGTFVCNDCYYGVLRGTDIPAVFIHLPYLPQQAGEGKPFLTSDCMAKTLQKLIENL